MSMPVTKVIDATASSPLDAVVGGAVILALGIAFLVNHRRMASVLIDASSGVVSEGLARKLFSLFLMGLALVTTVFGAIVLSIAVIELVS